MSISLITAITIQNQGDAIRRKVLMCDLDMWMGCIWLFHGENPHQLLISTKAIFESEKLALENVEGLVRQIREIDLAEEIRKNLTSRIGD